MQHRLKTTVVGVLIVMGLAACGGGGGGGGTTSTATPAGETGSTPGGGAGGATPNSTGDTTGSGSTGSGSSTGSGASTGSETAGPASTPSSNPPTTGNANDGSTSPGTPGGSVGSVSPQASAFAQVTVATNVIPAATAPSNQLGPVASRLANGGSVIVWVSGSTLMAQQLDGAGNKVGPLQTVSALPEGLWSFSVTGLTGGDWVVAWSAQTITPVVTPRAMPYTIQTKRFNASGAVVQDTMQLPGVSFQSVDPRLQVKATPDDGYVLAWSHSQGTPILFASFQRFNSNGLPSGARVFTGNSAGGDQTRIQAVPLGDGSVVIAWLQNTPATNGTSATYSVYMRRFDGAGNPLGDAREVTASAASSSFPFAMSGLSNGNLAVAWAQPPGAQQVPAEARWQVLGPDGSPVTTLAGRAVAPLVDGIGIAPASGAGFTVFAQASSSTARGSIAHIDTLAIDAGGALVSSTTIADRVIWSAPPSSGAGLGPASFDFAVASGNDGHHVVAFETAKQDGLAEVDALGQ